MSFFKNPDWIAPFMYSFRTFEDIPSSLFDSINEALDAVQSEDPLVSIVIPAWNEEVNVLRSIASLSKIKSSFPFEIIVVNNNSTDKTQKTIDEMIKVLEGRDVVCVYGRYSFISEPGYPRWKLSMFELMKDIIAEFRHINRPYFNAYGMSMAYVKEYGLKVGFISINRRGEDGQLCLDLMKYGKVRQVRSSKARTWTGVRTLKLEGSISNALFSRLKKELRRFFFNLHTGLPEDKQTADSRK
jgi:cellulose synthase/poly-beta-1,6-N-acetylglucosamine synthase-like glycosyltransferase